MGALWIPLAALVVWRWADFWKVMDGPVPLVVVLFGAGWAYDRIDKLRARVDSLSKVQDGHAREIRELHEAHSAKVGGAPWSGTVG